MKQPSMVKMGPAMLFCGDALEIMRSWGFPKVDLIVCDPPYKLTSGGPSGMMRGVFDSDNYDNGGEIVECDIDWPDFMPLLFDVLRDPGHAYVMCNNRHVRGLLNAADAAGFGFHNLLVWDKVSSTMNRWYMKNCEFTGFFFKGNAFMINDCGSRQTCRVPQVDESGAFAPDKKPHPTEKPVILMAHYITNSTVKDETVFDPFMGSGTTGVAAIRSGRAFIGIEKNPKHFATAVKRITAALAEERLAAMI